ncbi:pre-piRNA 3'-exonuclease trimmer-like [Colletes gigas]|uniref:pre-piRNA 3'-exonuclease trimmer-like n=1 Tax=Colletes gigas TaxID=935657 RepID=UPI001C9AA91C|nr:pre-piRNA 3'-exonuclease trimmer-like [Colletes gigas]
MNEVLNNNFKELYPELETTIKNASFIAFDAEFTGIQSDDYFKYSLFDSLHIRYTNLKENIESFVIVQYGIAAFQHIPDINSYAVKCYNFYLIPRSLPLKNRQFTWQVSALEFLSTNNFDFNKFADGVSYLDEIDETRMKNLLKEGKLACNMQHLTYQEEDIFKDCKNTVSKWLQTKPHEISFELKMISPTLQYMVHKELRNNFENIWTVSKHNAVVVIRVSVDMHYVLEKEHGDDLENELLDSYVGFCKVFKLLTTTKKPMIGHNILLDLMFIHQQFYRPLPNEYIQFKKNIHALFPQIYDTKLLSFEFKKLFEKEVTWKINSLTSIYEYFKTDQGRFLAFNSPNIKLEDAPLKVKNNHVAGWDAYFTGYIFIKMAHIFSIKKYGEGLEERPITHFELMNGVKHFVNTINITRGNYVCLKLDGKDPVSTRPEWLHVRLKTPSLNIKEITDRFSSFGHVDVMPFARKRVLLAVANHRSALDILNHFKNNKELQVARYNPIKHAPTSIIILWGGVVISGGIFAWVIHDMLKNTTTFN